ncbi:hypothetical protein [Wolbachia endosymbiont of Pentidionis agamae]|uniref:hypothetical protein n=1 Tax=Wolbachia endosymbiont of Pentidionis agamae TaxID=3110435 RepID=UPI002FD5AB1D
MPLPRYSIERKNDYENTNIDHSIIAKEAESLWLKSQREKNGLAATSTAEQDIKNQKPPSTVVNPLYEVTQQSFYPSNSSNERKKGCCSIL